MSNRLRIIYLVILLFAISCEQGEPYHQFHQIKGNKWSKNSSLDYLVDSLNVNPLLGYDVFLCIVNSGQYLYQNIWLSIDQNFADTISVIDTIEVKLAEQNGKWLGTGNVGLFQFTTPYKTNIHLDTNRIYNLKINHLMKDNPLKGIERVGVIIKASE